MTQDIQTPLDRRRFIAGGAVVTLAAVLTPITALAKPAPTGTPHLAVSQNELDWFPVVPGEEMAIHIHSHRVGGTLTTLESIAAPGAGTPPHYHAAADEHFFILEGKMHFMCNGVEFDAGTGSSVVIPRGAAHSWVNLTDGPVRTMVTFTPGGIEQMFPKMAAVFPAGIEALAAQFDTYLVK